MCKIIAVSNRALCAGDFAGRIRDMCSLGIDVILREKDLTPEEYLRLLNEVKNPRIIAHTFTDEARKAGIERVHLPLNVFVKSNTDGLKVSVSIHSADEARQAESLGAKFVTAGHIFETDCKKGLKGRGLAFLSEVKRAVNIPVYAIGGISPKNVRDVFDAGADGACIMSGFMKCGDLREYLKEFGVTAKR